MPSIPSESEGPYHARREEALPSCTATTLPPESRNNRGENTLLPAFDFRMTFRTKASVEMHFFIWARSPSVQVSPHHRRSTSREAFGTPSKTFGIPLYWLDPSNRRFERLSRHVSSQKALMGYKQPPRS